MTSKGLTLLVSTSCISDTYEYVCVQLKRCHNQVEGYGNGFEKMQIWIEIRDSVGFIIKAGENPVEVKHVRNWLDV